MKKKLYIIMLMTIILSSCYKGNKEIKENWDNGNPKVEIIWESTKDSTYRMMEYYENGKLNISRIFINGKIEKFTAYYETGEVRGLCVYNNGQRVACAEYYKNGQKMGEVPSDLNGKLNGHVKYFYENGTIRSEGEYKNNHQVGIWNEYNEQGQLVRADTLK